MKLFAIIIFDNIKFCSVIQKNSIWDNRNNSTVSILNSVKFIKVVNYDKYASIH